MRIINFFRKLFISLRLISPIVGDNEANNIIKKINGENTINVIYDDDSLATTSYTASTAVGLQQTASYNEQENYEELLVIPAKKVNGHNKKKYDYIQLVKFGFISFFWNIKRVQSFWG